MRAGLIGFALGTALVMASPACHAQTVTNPPRDIIYLRQLFGGNEYRFAYNRLLEIMDSPPTWLRRFNATGDGVELPVHRFQLNGRSYQIAPVCQPHNAETCLHVVFDMNKGPVAWGYYATQGRNGNWIGSPPLPIAEAVEAKVSDPNYFN